MPVLQQHKPGSLRPSDPRTKPVDLTDRTQGMVLNVVDTWGDTPDRMLVALRPYRAFPEVIEHMAQLDMHRLRRTS